MENITYQIRFLILNDENEVLKNFTLTEREYDTREEACEAAQTVCCVLMNHCGWDVFYRVVVSDGISYEDDEEEDEEEENPSFDKIIEENADEFLAWMRDYLNKNEKDE